MGQHCRQHDYLLTPDKQQAEMDRYGLTREKDQHKTQHEIKISFAFVSA